MAENEKPDFTVVDKRQSAPVETSVTQSMEAGESPSPLETAETDIFSEPVPSTDAEPSPGEEPFGLPDPAMLVAFAAMQTTPQRLLALLAPAFDSQARRALGLLADTQTGDLTQDLETAKTAIDAVQFCLSKAESTLEPAEHREMMRRLNDLRLTYVAKLQTS